MTKVATAPGRPSIGPDSAAFRIGRAKNNRLLFYLRGVWKAFSPGASHLAKLRARWDRATAEERESVLARTDHYIRLDAPFEPGDRAVSIRRFRRDPIHRRKSNFFFDLAEHLRHFDPRLRFHYRFGDHFGTPATPTFVKARALGVDHRNAVLMKLNKVRHYVLVNDPIPFAAKRDGVVWRGMARRENRATVVDRYHRHPLCDIGRTYGDPSPPGHRKPRLGIGEQLCHKFILSIEGNDVATNLKWILSSGSVCVMVPPTRESWFMEGSLVPGRHYVPLRDDHSDLGEQIERHLARPDLCREIVANANRHTARFRDPMLEDIVSLRVMERYFELSGQDPGGGLFDV